MRLRELALLISELLKATVVPGPRDGHTQAEVPSVGGSAVKLPGRRLPPGLLAPAISPNRISLDPDACLFAAPGCFRAL